MACSTSDAWYTIIDSSLTESYRCFQKNLLRRLPRAVINTLSARVGLITFDDVDVHTKRAAATRTVPSREARMTNLNYLQMNCISIL